MKKLSIDNKNYTLFLVPISFYAYFVYTAGKELTLISDSKCKCVSKDQLTLKYRITALASADNVRHTCTKGIAKIVEYTRYH